jgi:hypothetical protein
MVIHKYVSPLIGNWELRAIRWRHTRQHHHFTDG